MKNIYHSQFCHSLNVYCTSRHFTYDENKIAIEKCFKIAACGDHTLNACSRHENFVVLLLTRYDAKEENA